LMGSRFATKSASNGVSNDASARATLISAM
jgi:hypothetical protein